MPRRYAPCSVRASHHSSVSATLPPASKMPTTFQVAWPVVSVEPTVRPMNWPAAARPATISLVPNGQHPAFDDFGVVADLQDFFGSTPRSGTLAGVCVERFGRSTMT